MRYEIQEAKDVLAELSTGQDGLSPDEAARRFAQNGPNKLAEQKKPSLLVRFLSQLRDPMTLILLAAAAVSGLSLIHISMAVHRKAHGLVPAEQQHGPPARDLFRLAQALRHRLHRALLSGADAHRERLRPILRRHRHDFNFHRLAPFLYRLRIRPKSAISCRVCRSWSNMNFL